jgi:hypothetical protein
MTKNERMALAKEKKRKRDRIREKQIRARKKRKDRKSYEAQSLSAVEALAGGRPPHPTTVR